MKQLPKLTLIGCVFFPFQVLGLCRAGSYGGALAAAMEIFGEFGADAVSTVVLMPWGFGVFMGAPLSGENIFLFLRGVGIPITEKELQNRAEMFLDRA